MRRNDGVSGYTAAIRAGYYDRPHTDTGHIVRTDTEEINLIAEVVDDEHTDGTSTMIPSVIVSA